jgi:hypothetical protein
MRSKQLITTKGSGTRLGIKPVFYYSYFDHRLLARSSSHGVPTESRISSRPTGAILQSLLSAG